MRVLVVGGGGQLGSKISFSLRAKSHDVHSTYLTARPQQESQYWHFLDKTDTRSVDRVFEIVKPAVVIDTAALTNVDYCETHREEAQRVNADGTLNLALACKRMNAKMAFISTDYVFDGAKGNYSEEYPPGPVNNYGSTKLEGEKNVSRNCNNYLIVRSSVIYSWVTDRPSTKSTGAKPLNFGAWVAQKLSKQEPIRIVADQYCSPTLADGLADILVECLQRDLTGLFHVADRARISRFQFTLQLAECVGLRKDLITPINTVELEQVARRPMDSSLDVTMIERTLGHDLCSVDEALKIFARQARSHEPV